MNKHRLMPFRHYSRPFGMNPTGMVDLSGNGFPKCEEGKVIIPEIILLKESLGTVF
jgi:hypothetical protein